MCQLQTFLLKQKVLHVLSELVVAMNIVTYIATNISMGALENHSNS